MWVVGREALHGNEPMGYDLWWDRSDVTILGTGFSLVISVWTRRSSSSLRGRSRRHVIAFIVCCIRSTSYRETFA